VFFFFFLWVNFIYINLKIQGFTTNYYISVTLMLTKLNEG